MTADKPGRSCEQNLQSDDAEFLAHHAELIQSEIDLLVGMSGHETNANQLFARRNSGRNDGIDEHAFLLQSLADLESHHQVAAINGQNRRFRLSQIKAEPGQALLHSGCVAPKL